MEIFQFAQFRTIAECGTMREAAERLYLSQPTLSYNLKKLESELGCQLFVRSHNRLALSPYGEIVLKHVGVLQDHMDAMLAEIEEAKRREAATLQIGCFSSIASYFFMPQIASGLSDSFFEVTNCTTSELVDGLKDGRFDILIATDICREKSFKWHKLYTEHAFVSAPLGSVVAGLPEVVSSDLTNLTFNIEAGQEGYSDWYSYILHNAGVADEQVERMALRVHLKMKDTLPTCNLITSFIMDFVKVNESRVIVPISEPFAQRNIGLLYRSDAPEKVSSFVNFIRANEEHLFGGNTFIPYFFFPSEADNLRIING